MTPLAEITLHPRHHKAALWWLGLLYRRPEFFRQALTSNYFRAILEGFVLFLHFLPYFFLFILVSFILMLVSLAAGWGQLVSFLSALCLLAFLVTEIIALIIAFVIVKNNIFLIAIIYTIVCLLNSTLAFSLIIALLIAFGLAGGIAIGITKGIARGSILGLFSGIFFIPYVLMGTFDVNINTIFYGIIGAITFGLAAGILLPRTYYLVYHNLFIWPRLQATWYPYHPVAWDDLCGVPFAGLDKLLAGYAEIKPEAGQQEINRLINTYPTQRQSALRAQCRVIARTAGRETLLSRLDEIVANLPEGGIGFLAQTPKLKTEISDITALQRRLVTQVQPFLKEPEAALLVEKIRNFQSRVSGYHEPLGSEFRQAAGNWLAVAEAQYQGLRKALDLQPQPQVFRAGDPVSREQEAFVQRLEVLGELDRQLSLATGCPGLVLYGRRMGKSTLLKNLYDFLPVSVNVAVVSMQNPQAFSSLTAWLALVSAAVLAVMPENQRPALPETLPDFFALLSACNQHLQAEDKRLLLAIDEYEYLDSKIGAGVFPEDLLHTLRESIQNHRRIVWLFAGSHGIEELQHAQWSSYLISARTVEVPAFTAAETRLLLTEPMRQSRLWEKNEAARPRFAADFWGVNGIDRIHTETAGWPHLVQLLAETAVDLCNESQCQAINKAVTSGDTVLRQLLRGESTEADWAWLLGLRRRDSLPIPEDEAVYQSLRRRWLVVDAGNGEWRLRVPLLLRWLRERG